MSMLVHFSKFYENYKIVRGKSMIHVRNLRSTFVSLLNVEECSVDSSGLGNLGGDEFLLFFVKELREDW